MIIIYCKPISIFNYLFLLQVNRPNLNLLFSAKTTLPSQKYVLRPSMTSKRQYPRFSLFNLQFDLA